MDARPDPLVVGEIAGAVRRCDHHGRQRSPLGGRRRTIGQRPIVLKCVARYATVRDNPRIDSPVQLDFKLVEAEQVTSPILALDSYNGRSLITSPSGVELNQRESSLGLNFLGSDGIFSAFPFGRTTRHNRIRCRVGFLGDVYYCPLLDGGLAYHDFWRMRNGKQVIGYSCVRYFCYELGLKQPRKRRGENEMPTHESLQEEIKDQQSDMAAGVFLELSIQGFRERFRM